MKEWWEECFIKIKDDMNAALTELTTCMGGQILHKEQLQNIFTK